ncbi:MAG: PleD family two-component system response regulator [Rhizobiaceae bacterium]
MTAKILVVDDIPANVKLLQARLTAEYYEVVTAMSGPEALLACENNQIDLILLDVMMPGMDGFEVCTRLKADPAMQHVPVVMVTALDQPEDRLRGLQAGADDFLTKPVNDTQLLSRVKSLVRLKTLTDELRLRAATTRAIGIDELLQLKPGESTITPRLLLVDERENSSDRLVRGLGAGFQIDVIADPQAAFLHAVDKNYDCVLISTTFSNFDPLRLCSQLRSLDRTRFLPILLVTEPGEEERVMRGLELGVNDYVVRPVDMQELTARLRTQVRRKRFNDALRQSVVQTIEMAVTDGLTGLHNRRYLDNHMQSLFDRAIQRKRPLSFMIADIDKFKNINDTLGHDGGDDVLREFAMRLRRQVRGADLVCRFGGEEFVVAMPDTDAEVAAHVAERVRAAVESEAFAINGGRSMLVTTSIGVSTLVSGADSVAELMKRADRGLYQAKNSGRNRVVQLAA